MIQFEPFTWQTPVPNDCPFPPSDAIHGLRFLGRCTDYRVADTWYPSWASDGNLYSPWTDGGTDGATSWSFHGDDPTFPTTGNGVIIGDDPLNLQVKNLGLVHGSAQPYQGRYPCGSLVHNGIWYYGTYCLGPSVKETHEGFGYNWPILGPIPGFRISRDLGRTWEETPHTPARPLFPEPREHLGPLKIGAPHFVDFGQNMEHSPDGKAYLVAQGTDDRVPPVHYANLSWISADQVYLLRVTPSPETINDPSAYEFFAGHDNAGKPVWTRDFARIQPLLEWRGHMGCVTVTWNAPLRKYLMCVTDGWPTVSKMHSYVLEADTLTGPWRMAAYLRDFGEQAYFLNFPSKFIDATGRKLWLCYSGNFATDWNGEAIGVNPPGTHYGLVLQEVALL